MIFVSIETLRSSLNEKQTMSQIVVRVATYSGEETQHEMTFTIVRAFLWNNALWLVKIVMRLATNVTRFGEISAPWVSFKSFRQFFEGLVIIRQNFEHTLAIFCHWALFSLLSMTKYWTNFLDIWSHCCMQQPIKNVMSHKSSSRNVINWSIVGSRLFTATFIQMKSLCRDKETLLSVWRRCRHGDDDDAVEASFYLIDKGWE